MPSVDVGPDKGWTRVTNFQVDGWCAELSVRQPSQQLREMGREFRQMHPMSNADVTECDGLPAIPIDDDL